mmetsp:Transcript_31338/g.57827  ORF Transcript_31338/g.57827 Transcript_31338/m.57827 type:complete len:211 (-) Transcript_31338:4-636(-)
MCSGPPWDSGPLPPPDEPERWQDNGCKPNVTMNDRKESIGPNANSGGRRNCLGGVLGGPGTASLVILLTVRAVDVSNLGDKRIIRVGVREQRANGQQDLGDGQSRAPLILEDIKANATTGIDVGVVNLGGEVDLWGLERVVRREADVECKDASLERRVSRSHDRGLPVEQVIPHRSRAAVGRRVLREVLEFLVDTLQRHTEELSITLTNE